MALLTSILPSAVEARTDADSRVSDGSIFYLTVEGLGDPYEPSFVTLRAIEPNGTGRRVILDRVQANGFTASPDGTEIAFYAWSDGEYYLEVMDIDGGERRRLTEGDPITGVGRSTHGPPSWSPDGSEIAYVSNDDDSNTADEDICKSAIWVAELDGPLPRSITSRESCLEYPKWSPDGQMIMYTQCHCFDFYDHDLHVRTSEGTYLKELAQRIYDPSTVAWSPDGSKILFNHRGPRKTDIFVMFADGSHQKRLTDDRRYEGSATWSPNGNRVAYTGSREERHDLFLVDLRGSEISAVTRTSAHEVGAMWSPSGRSLAFMRFDSGLFTIQADGTKDRFLARRSVTTVAWLRAP